MIADMLSNKKPNLIVTELFIKSRRLNISLVFITKSYFAVKKYFRQNSTHYLILKFPNKEELQKLTLNHSSDIDFRDFTNLYQKCTAISFLFLVIDTTLTSDYPLCFRDNILKGISELIMEIDDQIRYEKVQYGINREAAQISRLLSGKLINMSVL